MNIKKIARNGLIGLTALVASACITKLELKNQEYTVETGWILKQHTIKKTDYSADSSKVYEIELIDEDKDGNLDKKYRKIIAKNGIYVNDAYKYNVSVTSLDKQEFSEVMDQYNK